MNGLRVQRSARDGIHIFEPAGPIIIANTTVTDNRGHGLVIENTTDGRMFVNYTLISGNYGDGIWYRQQFLGDGMVHFGSSGRKSVHRFCNLSIFRLQTPNHIFILRRWKATNRHVWATWSTGTKFLSALDQSSSPKWVYYWSDAASTLLGCKFLWINFWVGLFFRC